MKKIVLLLLVVCATVSMNAQVYVGGTAGFWRNDKDDADQTAFTIAPEIGYNFNEKWAIGAELGYKYAKEPGFKKNAVFVAPYARYSYCETGIVRLFLDGGVGFTSAKIADDRTNGFEIGIKPGVAIKLNDKFSLITKVGFLGYRDDYFMDNDVENGFGLNLSGADLRFGFQVNF
ncbi:outer membrane beta-barrel protein [Bacteroides sp. 51]|uniref:outer membrane beta-barrel protein n=1 Tax=Bacteroides sp. 51 TaxID=2302938 RepID=UPI0013D44FE5|nr:outer membrane beta-barrel protein [Bacteroides sp. 51]NDV83339.1 porin family protein [Bacteroides sp. 51]